AEAECDRDVVDPIVARLGCIHVFEGKLHTIVHVETTLRLPDQPEIRIVYHHVEVRQLELRGDGELLEQELEIVVAGQRHHLPLGVGRAYPERGRNSPAERPRLTAIDPVAWFEDVQEL